MSTKILDLKKQLEECIDEKIQNFKALTTRFKLMSDELDTVQSQMLGIAVELKEVESLIRLSDNTYPDLFDELINSKKPSKKGK